MLVLLYEIPDEEVQITNAVEVTIVLFPLGEADTSISTGGQILVMRGVGQIGSEKRVSPVLSQPLSAGLEHDVIFEAEVVGPLEPTAVHGLARVEVRVTEVGHQLATILEELSCRLKEDRAVALLTQELRQAGGGYHSGQRLGDGPNRSGLDPADDRDEGLRGMGYRRVGSLHQEALFRELVQIRGGSNIFVVRSDGRRPGRLEDDERDVGRPAR